MISDLPCLIHGYIFKKLIGKGGFSSVYLVQSERFQKDFCAKVMQIPTSESTEEETKTAINEMNALIVLSHPHILRLYDHFKDNSHFFLIIEYCPGGSLSNEVSKTKGLSMDRFKYLSKQIISALYFTHQHNIAHHDLKLGNILLDEFGRAKLADFGISVHVRHFGDLCESYAGSIEYESPEILLKKPHDPFAADVWALGVLFAHMIGGESPWRCDTIGKLKKCITKGVYRLSRSVPAEISEIISQMIVVEPQKRILISQLVDMPIFQLEEGQVFETEYFQDCLSPIGRQLTSNSAKSNTSTEQTETDTTLSGTLDLIEDENPPLNFKTSTTLSICGMNLLKGMSIVPSIKPRYHVKIRSFQLE